MCTLYHVLWRFVGDDDDQLRPSGRQGQRKGLRVPQGQITKHTTQPSQVQEPRSSSERRCAFLQRQRATDQSHTSTAQHFSRRQITTDETAFAPGWAHRKETGRHFGSPRGHQQQPRASRINLHSERQHGTVNITTQEKKQSQRYYILLLYIGCAMPQQRDPGQRGRKHGAARPNSLSVCSLLFGLRAARSSVAPPGQARYRARSRVSRARGKVCRTVPRRLCLERHDLAIHSQPCTRQRVALLNPATRETQKTPQTHKTQNTINTAAAVVLHQ